MGASKSKIHCPYRPYQLCKIKGCEYLHDDSYKPNMIKVLWHCPRHHPNWEYSIYTVDFLHFSTESDGRFDRIFTIKDLKSIHIYEHTGILSNRIKLEDILPEKQIIFYNLLRKYMMIRHIFNVSDLSNYIASLMKFDKILITTYK